MTAASHPGIAMAISGTLKGQQHLVYLSIFCLSLLFFLAPCPCSCSLVISHRGFSSKYPENTLKAVEAAVLEGGTDGIEFDLHLTADGELILQHDDTLDRMTMTTGPVISRSWKGDLEAVKTRDAREARDTGLPISRFADVMDWLLQSTNIQVLSSPFIVIIDVKEDQPVEVLDALAKELSNFNWKNGGNLDVYIGTWTEEFAQRAQTLFSNTPSSPRLTLITEQLTEDLLKSSLYDSFNVNINQLSLQQVRLAEQLKKPVFVWTCNEGRKVKVAAALKIAAILADDPILTRQFM